ncbi:MAG: hypothetical protein RL885_30920 [Planctomycetota bacterium]
MTSNPSVSRATSLASVTALLVAMAAGVLLGPADATAQESPEHDFTWEMAIGAAPWWPLPNVQPAGNGYQQQQQQSGGDIADEYEFILLPDLGLGMDINNKRQIVGLDVLLQGGVLIYGDEVTPINVPGAVFTQPTNINERGDIVGHYRPSDESPLVGFHRDRHGEYTTIAYPDPAAVSTNLWGLNQRGDIVGHFTDANFVSTPFILNKHGEFAILDVPGDGSAVALGINNRGVISGWFQVESGFSRGYLLDGDDLTVVDYPGAPSSDVGRVNSHGEYNGIHSTPPFEIGSYVRNAQGEFFDFSFPGYGATVIRGINDRGDQCGAASPSFPFEPFEGFVALRKRGNN